MAFDMGTFEEVWKRDFHQRCLADDLYFFLDILEHNPNLLNIRPLSMLGEEPLFPLEYAMIYGSVDLVRIFFLYLKKSVIGEISKKDYLFVYMVKDHLKKYQFLFSQGLRFTKMNNPIYALYTYFGYSEVVEFLLVNSEVDLELRYAGVSLLELAITNFDRPWFPEDRRPFLLMKGLTRSSLKMG